MGRGKFARQRGVLLNLTSKFGVLIGVLSIVGGADLARAADGGSSSAPPAQTDAVNQALLKKWK